MDIVSSIIQSFTLLAIIYYASKTKDLAKKTEDMAEATRHNVNVNKKAFLEPEILFYVTPYHRSGFLALTLENDGAKLAKNVTITFPEGSELTFENEGDDETVDLEENFGIMQETIESIAPGQTFKTGPLPQIGLPNEENLPYRVEYGTPTGEIRTVEGVLNFQPYGSAALPNYTDLEDIRKELEEIKDTLST